MCDRGEAFDQIAGFVDLFGSSCSRLPDEQSGLDDGLRQADRCGNLSGFRAVCSPFRPHSVDTASTVVQVSEVFQPATTSEYSRSHLE